MAKNSKKIILAAGGTGGHVFPAIATAEELNRLGYETEILTDKRGEKYIKTQSYKVISSASPNGIKAILKLELGFIQALIHLLKNRPSAVVGFGGYPSFPPLFAAKFLFIKTILHEQNSIQGKANRILAKMANVTASSFPTTGGQYVGNPVRADIKPTPYPVITNKVHLLVTGGSQGAKRFAEVVPKALLKFSDEVKVTHQVPENLVETVKQEYAAANIEAEVKSFFDDMPKRLEEAHLLIARSGASTVAELAIAGRPAIFVPLAIAADDHQRINAEKVVEAGGGWMILEKEFTPDSLASLLTDIMPNKLAAAAINVKSLAKPNAAKELANLVVSY